MSSSQDVLETLVRALGETREEVAEAYTPEKFRTGDPVARFVDRFMCEAQESGVLDAYDYVGSESWAAALDAVFDVSEEE